jgi:hypothetical protein
MQLKYPENSELGIPESRTLGFKKSKGGKFTGAKFIARASKFIARAQNL